MYPKPWLTVKHTYNLDASVLPEKTKPRAPHLFIAGGNGKCRRGGRCDAAVPDPLSARHLNKGYALIGAAISWRVPKNC